MLTWRRPESELVYAKVRSKWNGNTTCQICRIPPKAEYGDFLIVANEFPYDAVSVVNDMLVLKECVPSLSVPQILELEEIKQVLGSDGFYDLILENFPRKKTIPGHWHIHLLRLRPLEGGDNGDKNRKTS